MPSINLQFNSGQWVEHRVSMCTLDGDSLTFQEQSGYYVQGSCSTLYIQQDVNWYSFNSSRLQFPGPSSGLMGRLSCVHTGTGLSDIPFATTVEALYPLVGWVCFGSLFWVFHLLCTFSAFLVLFDVCANRFQQSFTMWLTLQQKLHWGFVLPVLVKKEMDH